MGNNLARSTLYILNSILLLLAFPLTQAIVKAAPSPAQPLQGCTVFYGFDGQTVLAGNNEDFNNPFTYMWFIPASPGRFGRVYFGYDDLLPQGGLNDQGVFFDALALPYKEMPLTSQRPYFPGGDLFFLDEILSHSAKVQDVLNITNQWDRVAGEYAQYFYGDRYGDSVILDGDTVLRKQGTFQLATNFRLIENPNPPYPEERYGVVSSMLSNASSFSIDLFRQALDAAHAEGDFPTLYSQVYELQTGIIHLYHFHDFQHESLINLTDELAKGPHMVKISSLFPKNDTFEQWATQQESRWKNDYAAKINASIKPGSQNWMSGRYVQQEEVDPGSIEIYMENDQLYMKKSNQLPIELEPTALNAVIHPFFNGMILNLTFQRNLWGQATGAQGTFSFEPYSISLPYHLIRTGVMSYDESLLITLAGAGLVVILFISIFILLRKRKVSHRVD